jgi:hypothetical protein
MTECPPPRLHAQVRAIGVLGPGLRDWPSTAAVLVGHEPYTPAPTDAPPPIALPPAERRRIGATVRLALAVAQQAAAAADLDAAQLATVFAASGGDGAICNEICSTLASSERMISPTRFHNSVHNATCGYWSIAMRSTAPSTALAAYDGSFAAGLLEALGQLATRPAPVLLVSYEITYPEPLHAKRPLAAPFACALLLEPSARTGTGVRIEAALVQAPCDTLEDPRLERLRLGVPAARGLPLLRQLARADRGRVVIDYLPELQLALEVVP